MANLPELSDLTKRKLALKWDALLASNRLTGQHLQWHEEELDRLCRVAAQNPKLGRHGRDECAADEVGVRQTVAVAEAWFKALSDEY